MAEAKKCKYCREWLTEQPQKVVSEAEMAIPQNEQTFIQPEINVVIDAVTPQRNQNKVKDVYFKAQEPGTLEKINPRKVLLDEFIIKDGILTVTTKKGTSLSAPINEVEVGYSETNVGKAYTFKYNGKKLTFAEMPEMLSDEEWVAIEEIVESCPNYGLSSYGAIQKAFYIAAGIVLLTIIAFRIVARCSS
ncbi:MAG: hypothetical protein IJQ83_02025 [Bacteroidales bacterium]|nr:hypothetical protein [Bacteroidales bacterium]